MKLLGWLSRSSRDYVSSTGYPNHGFRSFLASKPVKIAVTAVIVIIGSTLLWRGFLTTPHFTDKSLPDIIGAIHDLKPEPEPPRSGKGRLHLLVPATSSNSELCKLLLSAQILGYPTPVLINYGDAENEDPYVQHLGKVQGILNYLKELETSSDYTEDLVLIIDGYDVWFQLRPDILIKRFFAINEAANARAEQLYGEDLVGQYDMRQKVVFGPDKLCWPVDFSRPACWAVPESPLSANIFGPEVDHENRDLNEAKWLNSGTILGHASDLKDIFTATLESIHTNYVTNSDQFYFAEIFGEQEYARISKKPELKDHLKNKTYYDYEDAMAAERPRIEPELGPNRTEYHIGLDYASSMFQTLAFWKWHLVWIRAIDSWTGPNSTRTRPNPREFHLPEDIQRSTPPFEPFKYGFDSMNRPGWSEVELAYNTITKEFPVLLHITGNPEEKTFRDWWWRKLWFQAEGEKLRIASQKVDQRQISADRIAGLHWFLAEMSDAEDIVGGGKGGVFTDRRGWLSWNRVCKSVEAELYHVDNVDGFHPRVADDT